MPRAHLGIQEIGIPYPNVLLYSPVSDTTQQAKQQTDFKNADMHYFMPYSKALLLVLSLLLACSGMPLVAAQDFEPLNDYICPDIDDI
jgi:hypothetical protein